MTLYKLSPYAHILESRLLPGTIQYGIFHQMTGYVIEPRESVRALLLATRMGTNVSIGEDDFDRLGDDGAQLRELIDERFLIPKSRSRRSPRPWSSLWYGRYKIRRSPIAITAEK